LRTNFTAILAFTTFYGLSSYA